MFDIQQWCNLFNIEKPRVRQESTQSPRSGEKHWLPTVPSVKPCGSGSSTDGFGRFVPKSRGEETWKVNQHGEETQHGILDDEYTRDPNLLWYHVTICDPEYRSSKAASLCMPTASTHNTFSLIKSFKMFLFVSEIVFGQEHLVFCRVVWKRVLSCHARVCILIEHPVPLYCRRYVFVWMLLICFLYVYPLPCETNVLPYLVMTWGSCGQPVGLIHHKQHTGAMRRGINRMQWRNLAGGRTPPKN